MNTSSAGEEGAASTGCPQGRPAHRSRARVILVAFILALFIAWEWWITPRAIRLVDVIPERLQTTGWAGDLMAGEAGMPYAEGEWPDMSLAASTVIVRGWDGRVRWRVSLPALPARTRVPFWSRRVTVSRNAHILAEVRAEEAQLHITTWKDGARIGQVTLTAKNNPADLWNNLSITALDDGRLLLIFPRLPVLHLMLCQGNKIRATGTYTVGLLIPEPSAFDTTVTSDGQAIICYDHRMSPSVNNLDYVQLQVKGRNLVALRRYAAQAYSNVFPLAEGLAKDMRGTVFTDKGPKSPPQNVMRLNEFEGMHLVLQEEPRTEFDSSIRQPFVLNPLTGERWTVPIYAQSSNARVTPDGRYVALIGQRIPPQWFYRLLSVAPSMREHALRLYTSTPELLIYERPGRLRARVRGRGESPIARVDSGPSGDPFYLSPDGHRILLRGEKWHVYQW